MLRATLFAIAVVIATGSQPASAQRVRSLAIGITQQPMHNTELPSNAFSRRAVKWKSGATVGFVIGTALGAVALSSGDDVAVAGALYFGVLAGLVGALVEAMASGSSP